MGIAMALFVVLWNFQAGRQLCRSILAGFIVVSICAITVQFNKLIIDIQMGTLIGSGKWRARAPASRSLPIAAFAVCA